MMMLALECDMNRVDIKKSLEKVAFAMSRARKEVLIVGEKAQLEAIGGSWIEVISEAKEQSINIESIIKEQERKGAI